jgi:hypothetical protein
MLWPLGVVLIPLFIHQVTFFIGVLDNHINHCASAEQVNGVNNTLSLRGLLLGPGCSRKIFVATVYLI